MTHARPITREDLLHRWANANGSTYPAAHDAAAGMSNEDLREVVEAAERTTAKRGERAAFHSSTTSLPGITRW